MLNLEDFWRKLKHPWVNRELKMRLTTFTDYALRVLLFTAANSERQVTITEITRTYGISRGHLMKVVQSLANAGYLEATRGRSGGLKLGAEPEEINLGDVVRITEPDFRLVECFGAPNGCLISQYCKMPGPLNEALSAFVNTLDGYSLADLMIDRKSFRGPIRKNQPMRGPILQPA